MQRYEAREEPVRLGLCEIRSIASGFINRGFQFRAQVADAGNAYPITLSPWFPRAEPNLKNLLIYSTASYDEPDDTEYSRSNLNLLVNHLQRTGWELLPESGVHWYSMKFRHASEYLPDPAPSIPYTVGDGAEWRGKVDNLLNKYEKRQDAQSCRKLADGFMQFGVALEREYQFEKAFETYGYAAVHFEEIQASEEAAKAYRWAQRIMEFYRKNS